MIRTTTSSMERVATSLRLLAATTIPYNGLPHQTGHVIEKCRIYHVPTRSLVIFCRDEGMHECGWFKNPDWDRCRHLSLSFCDTDSMPLEHDHDVARQWVELLFGDKAKYLWVESSFSVEGKARGVVHYRVMCDPGWGPIIPRGEPYSKEWTEKGWKSWSDQQANRMGKGEQQVEGTPP